MSTSYAPYLFDYCHRKQDKDDKRIDLYNRLNEELEADHRNYFDVVAFTHADLDHIAGSTEFFHLNHSGSYQGGRRKIISELWVPAAMLLEPVGKDEQSDEFALWRKEARHRLLDGKGIRVFSQPKPLVDWLEPKLKERGESPRARDHLFVDAGTLVPGYTLQNEGIEFFCHSPFIEHCEDGDIVRNDAALILNIRMRVAGMDTDFFQVDDSTWEVLDDVVRITQFHGNDDRLRWDLFNVPHHCSYRAVLNEPWGETHLLGHNGRQWTGAGCRDKSTVMHFRRLSRTSPRCQSSHPGAPNSGGECRRMGSCFCIVGHEPAHLASVGASYQAPSSPADELVKIGWR